MRVSPHLTQKEKINKKCEADHRHSSEHEHHDKVRGFAPEASLLQHPTVAVGEDQVEQKVEAESSEEEEGGDDPPELPLSYDEEGVEVELER